MGYITNYKIKISGVDGAVQLVNIADHLTLYDCKISDTGTMLEAEFNDNWYSWKEDFERVSRAYPQVLFEVFGAGEESGDIWKARFRGGVSEIIHAKIVFDEFEIIK
jgi:hypothetical protein